MKCQILFSRKDKKNIINLSSVESAHSVVCVKADIRTCILNSQMDYIKRKDVFEHIQTEVARVSWNTLTLG